MNQRVLARPAKDEVRFYKKINAGGHYDRMARIAGCGHSSWTSAHKADKAEMGIMKLEGFNDWRSLQRCGCCHRGSVWRVRW